jgi:hypothetical protein
MPHCDGDEDEGQVGDSLERRRRLRVSLACTFRKPRSRPSRAETYASKRADWAKVPAGTEVAVAKNDGKSATVVLADYF